MNQVEQTQRAALPVCVWPEKEDVQPECGLWAVGAVPTAWPWEQVGFRLIVGSHLLPAHLLPPSVPWCGVSALSLSTTCQELGSTNHDRADRELRGPGFWPSPGVLRLAHPFVPGLNQYDGE